MYPGFASWHLGKGIGAEVSKWTMTPIFLLGTQSIPTCPTGLALISMEKLAFWPLIVYSKCFWFWFCFNGICYLGKKQIISSTWVLRLRMAIILVLHGRYEQFVAFLAPVCSSYSSVNLATSQRSILTPLGQVGATHVRRGNKMISRSGFEPTNQQTNLA